MTLHPQYLLDGDGKRRSFLLLIERYAALIERLEDLEEARAVLARIDSGEETAVSLED